MIKKNMNMKNSLFYKNLPETSVIQDTAKFITNSHFLSVMSSSSLT